MADRQTQVNLLKLIRRWRAKSRAALRASGSEWSGTQSLTESVIYSDCADELAKLLKAKNG